VARLLAPRLPLLQLELAADAGVPLWASGLAAAKCATGAVPGEVMAAYSDLSLRYLSGLVEALQAQVHRVVDLKELVVKAMVQDKGLIVALFQRCGEKELSFLVDSGLWFGFLLGLIQMVVWCFYDSPWTLTAGGALVGYATNWLALKCIFEPVEPTRVGPFVIQGLFLQRQKEVSSEFADFFVDRVLTSQRMFANLLTGLKAPDFVQLLKEHTCASFVPATAAAQGLSSLQLGEGAAPALAACHAACDRIATRLPEHLEALHPYVDSTLRLRETIKARLEVMSPQQFERVLHPVFEEDELTLIISGAVLGAIAGYIQQVTTVPEQPKQADGEAAAKAS
jgi:uncharacterized membrane protein YheB (UPF0754 family)